MRSTFLKKRVTALLCMIAVMTGTIAYAQSIVPQKDEKKGLWGYVSKADGKWVVKPKFEEAGELTTTPNGQLRGTVSLKGKKGLVDDSGKILGAGVVFEEMTPMEGDAMFVKVNGNTGVADYSGVYRVKPEITSLTQLSGEGYIADIKGKKGILRYDGSWLIEPLYKDINTQIDGYFIIDQGGKVGITDREGSMLLSPGDFSGVEPFNEYWKVKKGNKVGLYDLEKRTLLIKPEFYDVKQPLVYPNGYTLYLVADKPEKWGAMTANGQNVVKKNFSNIIPIGINGLLFFEGSQPKSIFFSGDNKPYKVKNVTKKKKQSGFSTLALTYNKNGTDCSVDLVELPNGEVMEGGWSEVKSINQFLCVNYDGKTILFKPDGSKFMEVDKTVPKALYNWTLVGNNAISPISKIYNEFNYNDNALLVKDKDENYLVLPNGNLASIPVDTAEKLGDNHFSARRGETAYLLSKGGEILNQGEYDKYVAESGLIKPVKNGKKGVLDNTTFSTILSPEYDDVEITGDNHFSARRGETAYLLSKGGEILNQGEYDKYVTESGLIKPVKNGKKGVLDNTTFSIILSPEYDDVEIYGDNLYMITNESKCGLFNPVKSQWYLNPVFDKITRNEFNEGYVDYWAGDRFGIIELSTGNILLPIERGYNQLKRSKEGQYYVKKGEKWGLINDSFSELIPPVYDQIDISSGMYSAIKGGATHYFDDKGKTIPATPKITFNGYLQHGTTKGRDNATFVNYDITMKFCTGKSYTLYADLYTKDGKKARDKWDHPVFGQTKIIPDGIDYHEDNYWSLINDKDLVIPFGQHRQDFYVTFRLIDNSTGKAVPLPGAKKLSFCYQW